MIYQVTDFGTYLGEASNNVYFYQNDDPGTALSVSEMQDFANVFDATVITAVRAVQVNAFVHDYIEIRNISNGVDFWVEPVNAVGTDGSVVDQRLPSFISLSFQLVRTTLATKSGRKSLGGVNEGRVVGNTYTFSSSAVQTALEDAFAATLSLDSGREMLPVIVKRPLPLPGAPAIINPIASANYRGLGTQNSRKPGRGD